jgi:outer membrane protein OmpA-like peptidoglycan-associated protein
MSFTLPRSLGRALVLATLVTAASAWPRPAHAQDEQVQNEENHFYQFNVDLFGGWHFYNADSPLGRGTDTPKDLAPQNAAIFGGRLGFHFNKWIGLEGEVGVSPTNTVRSNGGTNLLIFAYRGSFIVHLTDNYWFRPFILAGYGGMMSLPGDENIAAQDNWGYLHAGLGFKIGFSDRTGLRLEGRAAAPWTILSPPIPRGTRLPYGGPDFEALASLYLNFGELPGSKTIVRKEVTVVTPSDPDGDGISGAADKCPNIAEDKDGFEDEDGCPDPDNDKDGIPDLRDRCPNEPEDKDGFEDEDGCPDPDNDKDGIVDARDKCPNEPEDKDGFQDDDGCPDPDNDNDGIPDARDKCPNEPETKNNYQDDDGCPDEIPIEVKKFTGVIEGINYKTGSAEILPGSYAILDRAVKVLQDFPDVNLEISGHTDSRGKADYNRDLSQRRADAVKNYFVGRGINGNRLTSIGYGMDKPIADNRTNSGRARNRRTEFRLVNPGEK